MNTSTSPLLSKLTLYKGGSPSVASLALRVTLACIMWPHGAQKVFGWFGGAGLSKTYDYFVGPMEIWPIFAVVAIATEFLAPFFLLAGLCTRWAALFLMIEMIVTLKYNWPNGFFMNWMGAQKGEGIEFQLLYIGAAFALIVLGAGRKSLDHYLTFKLAPKATGATKEKND